MSQFTEEIQGSPLVGGTLGVNMETVLAVQTSVLDGGTKIQLVGRLKSKVEIATGSTLFTIALRHAPKTTRLLSTFVEPGFRLEITTGGLVKSVGAIPAGKEVFFDGLEFIV